MHWPLKIFDTLVDLPTMYIMHDTLWVAVQLGAHLELHD